MDQTDLDNRFLFHPVKDAQQAHLYEQNRRDALDLAMGFNERCPDSREKSLAITSLEEAVFWANAAIARAQ